MEYIINSVMNVVVPPASMVMMAFAWPTLSVLRAAEWAVRTFFLEDMENKVVLITGASSAVGEQIAYEYARRKANLVLVARREHRLFGIRENARILGARQVLVIAADVVKEDDCRRFVSDTISYFGELNHLVNTASLGHSFYFEDALDTSIFPHLMDINFWGNVYPTYAALPYLRQSRGRVVVNASIESWLPMPRMGLYAAAKAAVINFYDTLRYEVKDDVGITLATHGWIGGDMSRGKFMLEEGSEMQWREEREGSFTSGHVVEFARMMVAGACRGDSYVKYPTWYDIFLLYRVFVPDVLGWTFRLLLSSPGPRRHALLPDTNSGGSRPLLEGPLVRKPASTSPRKAERES
ncbi:Hydroxysteroid 11-beta-dehydrogenase 1-like protein [Rhynchospora pubera]|uniref:Hydroxysteroid 11-beta-dehydrogenase 1-like protein n=1 Tax=Rhynchospora pubera TaxID=906938 RepID=A0AAV8C0N8_9POAL|nr:Hydroxysteroid 11-beta-dehydrogenase 1-like protein [Rhynchospora pubera]